MRVLGEDLVFDADEADELLSIMAQYVPQVRDRMDAAEAKKLQEFWIKAGDFAHYQLIRGIWNLKREENMPFSLFVEVREKTLGRPPVIAEDETGQVIFSDSRQLLREAIAWAGINLVHGSVVLQNVSGSILNSSFEDNPISEGLGSTNDSLARRHTESMVSAGRKAAKWLIQLDQRSN